MTREEAEAKYPGVGNVLDGLAQDMGYLKRPHACRGLSLEAARAVAMAAAPGLVADDAEGPSGFIDSGLACLLLQAAGLMSPAAGPDDLP